ncbi:hypothetical protein [Aquimarina mytili]|uniref:Uncharacterized protein n=1 Tax=Aquimarina mytili TaxID=874423 RepID=A0A936ZVL1_9FLAO|nr:hypothetical protein [Aquimarina mytili]MBL0685473.1 hypothetical protein [Aquimarina mytili]
MKTRNQLKKIVLVAICAMICLSCEKPEEALEINNIQTEEVITKTVRPFLHMSFDADVSEEEASRMFNEALQEYYSKEIALGKISTKNWTYRITTRTGNGKYDGTDGAVKSTVRFRTNTGWHYWTVYLNNPGDDREKGKTDYYGIDITFDQSLRWVELSSASISLKGKDKWAFNKFKVDMTKQMQPLSANKYSGSSLLEPVINPIAALDNNSANGWDTWDSRYDAANNGYGWGRIALKQPSNPPGDVGSN